ncbi:benzoate 4-monooxygenase cytochrome P450 [Diaporthe sp. PMI_573]|nr:benzoate 4-monooxygenase cytochrome P450 [Diaporthaceae sp. PMI_573]
MALTSLFINEQVSLGSYAIFAAFLWLLYQLAYGIYQAYLHPLSRIPGPKLWIVFPFIRRIKSIQGTLDRDVRRFHLKYGEAVRYDRNTVTFSNAEAWKTIYGYGKNQFEKFVATEQIDRDSNILTANNENHGRLRRGISHAFSPRALAEQEPIVLENVEKLVRRLRDVAESRMRTEIGRWFHIVAFDIVGDLTFGEPLGGLDNNELSHVVTSVLLFIERGRRIFEIQSLLGWLALPLMPIIARGMKEGFMETYNFSARAVQKRIASDAQRDRKDFMYGLLRAKEEKYLRSEAEIITNANAIFIAGSDTTATLLTACTFYMLSNPQVYEKARDEVRNAFRSPSEINFNEATTRLPYLLAVLTETMRLYPPVPSATLRVVPEAGEPIFIAGYELPSGTFVGVHHSSAGLSPSNFNRPQSFIPERWLPEATQDPSSSFYNDARDAVQTFSYGPRNCVGKHVAYNEMRTIMARLLWEFDMKLDQLSAKWTRPYSEHKSWLIWNKPPLFIYLQKRQDLET